MSNPIIKKTVMKKWSRFSGARDFFSQKMSPGSENFKMHQEVTLLYYSTIHHNTFIPEICRLFIFRHRLKKKDKILDLKRHGESFHYPSIGPVSTPFPFPSHQPQHIADVRISYISNDSQLEESEFERGAKRLNSQSGNRHR